MKNNNKPNWTYLHTHILGRSPECVREETLDTEKKKLWYHKMTTRSFSTEMQQKLKELEQLRDAKYYVEQLQLQFFDKNFSFLPRLRRILGHLERDIRQEMESIDVDPTLKEYYFFIKDIEAGKAKKPIDPK